jgi:hypothetical protein
MGWYATSIEPPADPHYLVRDYSYQRNVREVWRDWNSFTRVGTVESIDDPERPYAIMSLANGDGMAWLLPYVPRPEHPWRHRPTVPALLLGPPDDTLVLFAGAGADLLSLHENAAGRVTGVELNSLLVGGALELDKYRLDEFLAKDSIALEVAEGRGFLERDSNRYDVILLSWSGATASYYAGSLGGTTQFLFTYEGLAAVLDHLKPGGYAVILQVNKVNSLAALRRYLDERDIENPSRAAMVLFEPGGHGADWRGTWDNNPLFIKPDGWTDEEVARLKSNAAKEGWEVAYAPGLPVDPDYAVYGRIMQTPDIDAELAALRRETSSRYDIVTDDRPFYLDLFLNELYTDVNFWSKLFRGEGRSHEIYHGLRVVFVAQIVLFSAILILCPLFVSTGPAASRRTFFHLGYFFCLGAGFMLLEIVLMQKGSLLFGTPGLTIAIVLASIILFSGIGSLISNWSFQHGLTFRMAAAAVFGYALGLHLGLDTLFQAMVTWPLLGKGLGVAAMVAPGALLMGHLFPQGLAVAGREDAALVPWAWGINGAMSTVSAGVAPLLAQAWGFNVLILVAAGLYAVILLLPPYRRGRAADELDAQQIPAVAR